MATANIHMVRDIRGGIGSIFSVIRKNCEGMEKTTDPFWNGVAANAITFQNEAIADAAESLRVVQEKRNNDPVFDQAYTTILSQLQN